MATGSGVNNTSALAGNYGEFSSLRDYLNTQGGLLCQDNNAAPGELACATNLDCARYPGTPYCNAQTGVCQSVPAPAPTQFYFRPFPHADQYREWVFDPFRARHYPRRSLHSVVESYTTSYT